MLEGVVIRNNWLRIRYLLCKILWPVKFQREKKNMKIYPNDIQVETIVGKIENAGHQPFLLLP